jgi:hypothetical protein
MTRLAIHVCAACGQAPFRQQQEDAAAIRNGAYIGVLPTG